MIQISSQVGRASVDGCNYHMVDNTDQGWIHCSTRLFGVFSFLFVQIGTLFRSVTTIVPNLGMVMDWDTRYM